MDRQAVSSLASDVTFTVGRNPLAPYPDHASSRVRSAEVWSTEYLQMCVSTSVRDERTDRAAVERRGHDPYA